MVRVDTSVCFAEFSKVVTLVCNASTADLLALDRVSAASALAVVTAKLAIDYSTDSAFCFAAFAVTSTAEILADKPDCS